MRPVALMKVLLQLYGKFEVMNKQKRTKFVNNAIAVLAYDRALFKVNIRLLE